MNITEMPFVEEKKNKEVSNNLQLFQFDREGMDGMIRRFNVFFMSLLSSCHSWESLFVSS